STFLNSFLFGQQLLPAATTPMTAALSVITYGDKKGVTAEFYTPNEWEELKALASRDENKVSDSQTKSSIKAAKELYEKARPIMSSLPSLLGKAKEDKFNNLIEYVGADGKYVSIVKSVRITLPEDWLKGVEIVDTPGFNDPVVSREERTKEFLKRADVVLMMLYAGRAFDATDRDILFDKVRKVGVGKIILAVNKYDIQLEQGESPEQIKENVSDEIRKAMRYYKAEALNELLEDLDPILVSAQMALLAKMPMTEINNNSTLKYHYDKACDDFEIAGQRQLLKLSRISDLEDKVCDIIVNQKEKILIDKPKNLIFAKVKNAIDKITEALVLLNKKKEELSMPDDELIQRITNLKKAQHKIKRKIQRAESDLADEFDDVALQLFRNIQDTADNVKDECNRIIDNHKRDGLRSKLKDRLEKFETREFPRQLQDVQKKLKSALDESLNQLTDDIESVLKEYIEDADDVSNSFIQTMKKGLDVDVEVGLYKKYNYYYTPWVK
ncbi:MAG: dynamin family protein, partial [Muribaculaceae bacterium]|nr:dynamin family protein [Muribaculaceae bacterium]